MSAINDRLTQLTDILQYDSPAALAKASGIDPNTLRRAMQGPSKPGFDVLHGVLAKHEDLRAEWLMLGKGSPLRTADEAAPVLRLATTTSPVNTAAMARQLTEAHARIVELELEIKEERKQSRLDLRSQASLYNSVKETQSELIARLYSTLSEYELRLGLRKPTAEERQQQEQAGSSAPRMEVIPFGGRYRNAEADESQPTNCVMLRLYPGDEVSELEAA